MSSHSSQIDLPSISASNLKRVRSLHQKKYRDAENAFLAEGVKLCNDALASNVHIRQAIVDGDVLGSNNRVDSIVATCRERNLPIYQTTQKQFASLSEEQSTSLLDGATF